MHFLPKHLSNIAGGILTVAAAAVLAAPGTAAAAAPAKKIVIVVDSSGSMAQRAGRRSRMAAARSVIGDLVDGWDKDTELGLIAYGHRRKGACDDIQVIVPVGKVRPGRIKRAVARLHPVGKTPLSAAVRRAAELLKYTEEKATVVLISDGKENCGADPCALGRELEKKGVDFTAHVIGFDVRKSERAGLRCLAENTGGRYADAANPRALEKELTRAVEKEPKQTAGGPLRFEAILSEGGKVMTRGVGYRVFRDDGGKRGKRVATYHKARPVAKLKPGRYIVQVSADEAVLYEPLTVDANSHGPVTFVLNAGYASFRPFVSKDAKQPLKRGAKWKIRSKDGGFKHTEYKTRPTVLMPAGDYTATVRWGRATDKVDFTVTAGERVTVKAVVGAGILALDAAYAKGGPKVKKGGKWTIFEAKASLTGKHTRVATEHGARKTLRLPAGEYVGSYRKGDARTEFKATVTANQRTELTANLDAGVLALDAKLSEGGTVNKARWWIYKAKKSIDGSRTKVADSRKAKPTFTLNAGTYFVRVRYYSGKKKKRFGTGTVTVKAGERTESSVKVAAVGEE